MVRWFATADSLAVGFLDVDEADLFHGLRIGTDGGNCQLGKRELKLFRWPFRAILGNREDRCLGGKNETSRLHLQVEADPGVGRR